MYLSLALQGDKCTINKIDMKHIVAVATGKSDEEIIAEDMINVVFNEGQLNVIEADLNKYHSSEKVQHAMKILRGLQNRASPEVFESTRVSDKTQTYFHITFACF